MRHHSPSSGIIALLAAIVLIAGCASTNKDGVPIAPTAPGFGEAVGDVSCDFGGHDAAFHLHSQLAVYLPDGTRAEVPADIGVGSNCMYWLHTHDETGELHVEAPAATSATLANFLEIWRRSTNPTIPDAVNAGLAEVRVMGEVVTDLASVELTDGLGIEILLSAYPAK